MDVEIIVVAHASAVAAIPTASGPQRLLESGLSERLTAAGHSVRVSETGVAFPGALGEVAKSFASAASVAQHVREARTAGRFPVVLSGSCHTALGSVSGLESGRRGVIWFDSHGDFNTPETTDSGLLDGMTLATITGRCWGAISANLPGFEPVPDERVLMIGVRQLDRLEEELLERSAVGLLAAERVASEADAALRTVAARTDSVYIHLDLDVLDPTDAKANAFAAPGGLKRSDLMTTLGHGARICSVGAIAVTSYDPEVDPSGKACDAAIEAVETVVRTCADKQSR